jgi:hypothetical protein
MGQSTPIGPRENDLELLETAAGSGDLSVFAKAEQAIDWMGHPPEDLIHAVDLAISIGAFVSARRLSEIGARQFPDHETVQRYARVLAPPKILRTDLPPDPGAAADMLWLKKHSSEYRNRWVALKDGELLDSAESFEQLIAKHPARSGVLLTRIP